MNQLRTDLNRSFSIVRNDNVVTISTERNRFGKDQSITLVFGKVRLARLAEERIRQSVGNWSSLRYKGTQDELDAIAYDFGGSVDFTEVM